MRDLRLYESSEIEAWVREIRAQLNTGATSITFAGGGGATYSIAAARQSIDEMMQELDARDRGGRRPRIRSYLIRPWVY
ncbi:hypothetical protein [Bosea sp. (in: a-proteobacteria)]|uniref:hypothetical protein n=1 Tax=Bosea sp. (in: a-proteobacteria) TaxID=1871050 RepID=UPI0027347CBE|nr:hypothetical protein [Bosea sp. (in: a-proteobacteria)]MDP3408081.1 hypothetical protein [Bosea sp. (in: a-proteobacteria)]